MTTIKLLACMCTKAATVGHSGGAIESDVLNKPKLASQHRTLWWSG